MQGLKWFVGALALLALACGEVSEPSTPVVRDGEGLLELPLVSTSAGRSYKLVGATFAITGPQNATITDTSADSVSVALMAGTYSIQMNGEWHVERTDAPGVAVPVTLVSPNPMTFVLGEGETRPVRFLFKVPGDATANVGIGVDSGGWISGTLQFGSESPPAPVGSPGHFGELNGKTVPFVISFQTVTVTRSENQGRKELSVVTGPISLQFGGTPSKVLLDKVIPALQGLPLTLQFAGDGVGSYLSPVMLENPMAGLSLYMHFSAYEMSVDSDGYPNLRTFNYEFGFANLQARVGSSVFSRIEAQLGLGTISPQ